MTVFKRPCPGYCLPEGIVNLIPTVVLKLQRRSELKV